MMDSERFAHVHKVLRELREQAVQRLRLGDETDALALKLEVDDALRCLAWVEHWALTGREATRRLPDQKTRTPSSQFRVVEDHESDRREHWEEVEVEGERVRAFEESLLVDPPAGLKPRPA